MMKSKIRFILLAVLMALMVIAPATSVSRAQDTASMCLPGMDADTCTLFTAALTNAATLQKFTINYDLALKTTGTTSDVDVAIKGSGPLDVSGLAAAAMSASPDPSALLKDLKLQQTIEAAVTSSGSTMNANFEFRIVDGTLYYMSDMMSGGKWLKLDLLKALASASGQLGAMQGQMAGASSGAMSAAMNPEFAKLFADPTKFFTTEVGDGEEVDGVATTSITLNVNIKALVETIFSPEARPFLIEILKAQGQAVDEKQLDQMTALIRAVAPTLEATKLSVSWLIDPEAQQFRGFGINFSSVVDASTAALLQAPGEVTADFSLNVTLTGIGDDVTVEPVADAVDASAK